jgi:hypothetical protein
MASSAGTAVGAARIGGPGGVLADEEIRAFVHDQLAGLDLDRRRVCVLVPDATRTCPLPLLAGAVHEALAGRAAQVSVVVALGTQAPLDAHALAARVGPDAGPHRGFAVF